MLAQTVNKVAGPLAHIINLSLENGIFPSDLKLAKVIPIFKSGDQSSLNNYRPISLLSSFSKIFERIIYNKIMSFLQANDILYPHQYGFRPNHSTIHPVIHLLSQVAEANNKTPSEYTLATFCDLSKAFDTISHDILLYKLHVYGIRGKANDLIRSYLSNRQQYVDFDSSKSQCLPVECGVPQGSILGPLLFLIYINDIKNCTPENILSFADDTTMLLSHSDPVLLYDRANRSLSDLFHWFCANKLSLNAKKTQYILIQPHGLTHYQHTLSLKINGEPLSRVNASKFLGITIDESLSWKPHLACVNKKISNALFIIKQLKFSLPKDSLRVLYFSLLHSHLSYGILAWGNAKNTVLRKTELIQKRALRTIHNKSYNSHTDPLFKQSGILKLSDIYQLEVLMFMHDFINNKLPLSFQNMFILNADIQNTYQTRQSNMFHMPLSKSRFVDKLPLLKFPSVWNSFSEYNYINGSRKNLKRSFKSTHLNHYLSVVKCENPRCKECC